MTPFEQIERELRLKGVVLRPIPGEFRIEHGGKFEIFPTLEEAAEYGRSLPPPPPPKPISRRRKIRWMSPKARIRAHVRAHNRKLRFRQMRAKKKMN
jgi:hypothetical protein